MSAKSISVVLALAVVLPACGSGTGSAGIDPAEPVKVARGKTLYAQYCASCHGERLQGQPDWRERLPNGRMPAPPHDESGHTWHHPDEVLFGITKEGLVPGKYAPPGYVSDMPAFKDAMSDEDIAAVLSYIQSTWGQKVWEARGEMMRHRRG